MAISFDKLLGKPLLHEHSLNSLSDTNISNPNDGELLKYDSGSSKWIPGEAASGGVASATKIVAASNSIDTTRADYVCDGTDDEEQINAAILALSGVGGKVVLMEGTYTIGSGNIVLDSNITLSGQGWGTVIDFNATSYQIYASSKSNIFVRDLFVKESLNAKGHIYGTGVSNFTIKNVRIERISNGNVGIYFEGSSSYILISGCYIKNFILSPRYGIRVNDGINIKCINNTIDGAYWGVYFNTSTQNIIANNVFSNCTYGIRVKNPTRIIGNQIDASTSLYDLEGSACSIIGNYFGGTVRTGVGLYNTFVGNVFWKSPYINNISLSLFNGNYFHEAITYGSGYYNNIFTNNMGKGAPEDINFVSLKNTSGATVNAGSVVVRKAVATGDEFTTTTTKGDNNVVGVLDANISNNVVGLVQTVGKNTKLKVDGTDDIAIGDFLTTFTTAGIACKATAGDTVFGIALEAYTSDDSNGVIDVMLIPPRKI